MRILVALGGNALLRRGQQMTVENQQANVAVACERLAAVAVRHELVVSHGNGPQIGLLALEGAAYEPVPTYPLDVLGAETQGMIGYLIAIELTNRLPADRRPVVMLTMIEVDPGDPAFQNPTKPIGPIYTAEEAEVLAVERHWTFKPDGDHVRRVVASPVPRRIVEERQIVTLLDAGYIVVCAGGGGIPIVSRAGGVLEGVEAVIDKDHASALLAREIGAEVFVMATDTPAAFVGFGTPQQRAVRAAHPDAILADHGAEFAEGSMLPKVTAACDFARSTGQRAVIGQLADIDSLVAGTAGTQISIDTTGVVTGELSSSKET